MEERKLLVCPHCYSFYSAKTDSTESTCEKCGFEVKRVDVDWSTYAAMSQKEKDQFKAQYLDENFDVKPFQPMKDSKMVGFVGCTGGLTIGLSVLGGTIAAIMGFILPGIAALLAGMLSGGVLYVLAIIAEDTRHTRNQVDKLLYLKSREDRMKK